MARQDESNKGKRRSQQEKIEELTEANETLERRLDKTKEFCKTIIEQKDLLKEAKWEVELEQDNQLQEQLKAQLGFNKEIGIVWKEKKALNETITALQKQVTELTAQANQKVQDTSTTVGSARQVKADIRNFEGILGNLQNEVEKLGAKRDKLRKEVDALDGKVKAGKQKPKVLDVENKKLQEQLQQATASNVALTDQVSQYQGLETEKNNLEEKLQRATAGNLALISEISRFTGVQMEVDNLRKQLQDSHGANNIITEQNSQTSENNQHLTHLNESLQLRLVNNQKQIDDHLKRKAFQESEMTAYAADCVRLRLEKGQLLYEKGELEKILASKFAGPPYTGHYNPFPEPSPPSFSPLSASGAAVNGIEQGLGAGGFASQV